MATKNVTAIKGVSSKCSKGAAEPGPGSTIYTASWVGKTPQSPSLQVTVAHYTDSSLLALAVRNLKQGLPGGTPKKVAGIGSAAYEATGASATGLHFAIGKYVVYITLTSFGKPSKSAPGSIENVGKAVASAL